MPNPVHHIELWTADFDRFAPGLDWLLSELGWGGDDDPLWHRGRSWQHPSGVYLVLEQSPDVRGSHDRTRPGLNHLALRATDRVQLDRIRTTCHDHGWRELFGDRYPHAGGSDHTALFVENGEGFEVELVLD